MRCISIERFGDPAAVVSLADRPMPEPGPGLVRVRMTLSNSFGFGGSNSCVVLRSPDLVDAAA